MTTTATIKAIHFVRMDMGLISFLEWTERRDISLDAIHDSESQKKALYDFRQKIRHFRHVGFLNLFRIPELS
jgi:hypothetical protein